MPIEIAPPSNQSIVPKTPDEITVLYRRVHGEDIEEVNSTPSAEDIRFWMHQASSAAKGLPIGIRRAARDAMDQARNK